MISSDPFIAKSRNPDVIYTQAKAIIELHAKINILNEILDEET